VVAVSIVGALIMETHPPKQGLPAAFVGALIVTTCIAVAGEGIVFGAIRLFRYAWSGQ
jgi:hypothetical protein